MDQHSLALEFLSSLESQEAGLLTWGLVDGAFNSDELLEKAEAFLNASDTQGLFGEPLELCRYLREHGLLYRDTVERKYRTRMAETIRLLSHLRQILPWTQDKWETTPSLVADFRFQMRPREYPVRRHEPEAVAKRLQSCLGNESLPMDLLRSLLRADTENPFKLAEFQVKSAETILGDLGKSRYSKATIVTAGTGTGKTLAFYLPAFLDIGRNLGPERYTSCLAIYPRSELLKDQLSEAVRQARHVAAILGKHDRRSLSIGAFFSLTPNNSTQDELKKSNWKRKPEGFICPYLNCPECKKELVWKDADREASKEKLECSSGRCSFSTRPDELILTRDQLKKTPPDILFTTTETLNQRMSERRSWKLLGIDCPENQRPRMVLLDEVHTYEGVLGAHIALLLRRWRYRSWSQPHFVGLSATLAEAPGFFSELVGLQKTQVHWVDANQLAEKTSEGMEYLLAVRGDPVSQTALLATTIQTGMLFSRVLDPEFGGISKKAYGSRAFVFTDDLDVTNRLLNDLRDAEGRYERNGKPAPGKEVLAHYRASSGASREKYELGQVWEICENLGHSLSPGIPGRNIERTTSQDAGVAPDADIVVCSASLEVGFNDDQVGVVIQHKAPRDSASFLQRKGRAGRDRTTRPWTVVVLSDYARDRLAYQGYDQLFNPELRKRRLPIRNSFVLRIQAAYALIDWLAHKLKSFQPPIWSGLWWVLSGPVPSHFDPKFRESQKVMAGILEEVLRGGNAREELESFLRRSLKLEADENHLASLLWEPPRAIFSNVIPALIRRLRTEWTKLDGGLNKIEGGDWPKGAFWSPLPDAVPRTLFGDLNVPELKLNKAHSTGGSDSAKSAPYMALDRGMKEFAPGKVSLRFAIHQEKHPWVIPPLAVAGDDPWWRRLLDKDPGTVELEIKSFCQHFDEMGEFEYYDKGKSESVRCLRPVVFEVVEKPREVLNSSKARLDWKTQIVAEGRGDSQELPASRWGDILQDFVFHTHSQFSQLEVRRFSFNSKANLHLRPNKTSPKEERNLESHFVDGGKPAGLGFVLDVDGFVVRFRYPDEQLLSFAKETGENTVGLRFLRFEHEVQSTPSLDEVKSLGGKDVNIFKRDWLIKVYCAGLTQLAFREELKLPEAIERLSKNGEKYLSEVLKVIFQSLPGEGDKEEAFQKTHTELLELLACIEVRDSLTEAARYLWVEVDEEEWLPWLRERFKVTLAAALKGACEELCPEMDSGDLLADLDPGPGEGRSGGGSGDTDEIWFTESTIGGGDVVETILSRYAEDPQCFFYLLTSKVEPSELEVMDGELKKFLRWVTEEKDQFPEVYESIQAIRAAGSHEGLSTAFHKLLADLSLRGLCTSHSIMAALNSRILRPGTSQATDELLLGLMQDWERCEKSLGIEIDARVFAYLKSSDDELDVALRQVIQGAPPTEAELPRWRFEQLYGFLWPRGTTVRTQALQLWNPYVDSSPRTERLLLNSVLRPQSAAMSIEDEDWFSKCSIKLNEKGSVRLSCGVDRLEKMKKALLELNVNPVDALNEGLLLHPGFREAKREGEEFFLHLDLPEINNLAPSTHPSDSQQRVSSRQVLKSRQQSSLEASRLLEHIFIAELIKPSREFWLAAPWITDISIFDNRSGAFRAIEPSWTMEVSLVDVLLQLMKRGTKVHVVTKTETADSDQYTQQFVDRLKYRTGGSLRDQLRVVQKEDFHLKGILSDDFWFHGSMNITHRGVVINDELITLNLDEQLIATTCLNFSHEYGLR